MRWMTLVGCGLVGCIAGKGDSGDQGTEPEYCQEVSYLFNTGPTDQLPECVQRLTKTMGSLSPDDDFSNSTSDASTASDPAEMSEATLAALHGQLNGYLLTAKPKADAYELVCEQLVSAVESQIPPHGEEPGEICDNAELWASNVGLSAYFSCEPVQLSDAMTEVLGGLTGVDMSEAFWARVFSDIGTNPNLIWMPMFLAMHHGGSPAALFYTLPSPTTGGVTKGNVAILELGMEVRGAPDRVADFWKFIDDPFDQDAYAVSDWSDLEIIIPSRLTWRDDDTVSSWELGEAIPEPFSQQFTRATGLIDPCVSERRSNEGIGAGGASGECFNSFERMMATVNDIQTISSFTGVDAARSCDRQSYDFSLP